jgi:hypothetical protein
MYVFMITSVLLIITTSKFLFYTLGVCITSILVEYEPVFCLCIHTLVVVIPPRILRA